MSKNKPAETFSVGLRRAWLDNNRIALILAHEGFDRQSINAWAELIEQTVRDWPEDQPVMLIQDVSRQVQSLPYGSPAETLGSFLREGQKGYTAIVIGSGRMKSVFSRFMNLARSRSNHTCERVFTSREQAYNWLHQMMQDAHVYNNITH